MIQATLATWKMVRIVTGSVADIIAPKYIKSNTLKYGGDGIKEVKKYNAPVTLATDISVPNMANTRIAPLKDTLRFIQLSNVGSYTNNIRPKYLS